MTRKCFKCGELGHRLNECRAWKTINLVKDSARDGSEEEIFEEDVEVEEEVGEHMKYFVQRLLYIVEEKNLVQRNHICLAYYIVLGQGYVNS